MKMEIELLDRTIDLGKSELLRKFDVFDPEEWSIVRHSPNILSICALEINAMAKNKTVKNIFFIENFLQK